MSDKNIYSEFKPHPEYALDFSKQLKIYNDGISLENIFKLAYSKELKKFYIYEDCDQSFGAIAHSSEHILQLANAMIELVHRIEHKESDDE